MGEPRGHYRARGRDAGHGALCAAADNDLLRSDAMSTFGLERVFAPRNVALVGGSPRASSLGAAILRNLSADGFAGETAVVNPRHSSIGGRRPLPHPSSLPPGPPPRW